MTGRVTTEESSRDRTPWTVACVWAPHPLGSLGVATVPTTVGGGGLLGTEVKGRALSPGAEGRLTSFLLPLHGLYFQGGVGAGINADTQASARASSSSPTGTRTSPLCLWAEATESCPSGSSACDHEYSCCAPTAEAFLTDP